MIRCLQRKEVVQVPHRPKVSRTFQGTFDHAEFEILCGELRKLGHIESSMCNVESSTTVAMVMLHTLSSSKEVGAVIRRVLANKLTKLDDDAEITNAEAL